ncbi:MAG: hypothetical protein ACRDZN_07185 [Acidimicrobiales bacterium]
MDLVLVALGALALGAGVVVWVGSRLAAVVSGGSVSGGIGDSVVVAAVSRRRRATHPRRGRGTLVALPGPTVYWACTGLAAVALGAVVGAGVWVWRRWSSPSRALFGVPTDARVARLR